MMRLSNKPVILIAVLLILSVASVAMLYSRIAVFIFAKQNNIEIIYRHLASSGFGEFNFKGLEAYDRKHRIGFSASSAKIIIKRSEGSMKEPVADFLLNDVNFIKSGNEEESSYKNIDGLISLPLSSLWKYKTISGEISSSKNALKVKGLLATGEVIKFSCDGTLTESNVVDADIVIYFEKSLIDNIPAEISGMALKGEDSGWKSLAVKIEGDLAKPAIKVTGKLFRLNIGVK